MTQILDSRTISAAIRSPSMLASLLGLIKETEQKGDYTTRNTAALHAVVVAQLIGIPAGISFDPHEPDWPVAMIELPHGQVSWHLQKHGWAWDGHTTEQKWERVDAYIARERGADTPMLHNAADFMATLKYSGPQKANPVRQELDELKDRIQAMRDAQAHINGPSLSADADIKIDPRLAKLRDMAEKSAREAGLKIVRRDETIVDFMGPEVKDDGSAD